MKRASNIVNLLLLIGMTGLIGVMGSPARAQAQTAPITADTASLLDSELKKIRDMAAQEWKKLETDRIAAEKEIEGLSQSLSRLAAENETLERGKSVFNRNSTKIKKNATEISQIEQRLASIRQGTKKLQQAVRARKVRYDTLSREWTERVRLKSLQIQKSLDLMETEELQILQQGYSGLYARQKAQIDAQERKIRAYTSPGDPRALELEGLVRGLRTEAEATAFNLQKLQGELSRRLDDRARERENAEENEQRHQDYKDALNFRDNAARRRAGSNKPPPLSEFFRPEREQDIQAAQERQKDEARTVKLALLASVAFLLTVILYLRKRIRAETYKSPASRPRRRGRYR